MTASEGKKSDREDDDKDEEPPEDGDNENEGPEEPGPEEKGPEEPRPNKDMDETRDQKQKRPPPTVLPKPKPKAKPLGEIPVFISSFGDRTTPVGSLVRLDAVVKSDTDVNVEWRKNDEAINFEDLSHFTVISEGNLYSLLITETSENDSGVYTCLLTNNTGTAKCSAKLEITAKKPGKDGSQASEDAEAEKKSKISKLEEFLPLVAYVAVEDYEPDEGNKMHLKCGEVVEVIDSTQDDNWLVRKATRQTDIGFVTPTCLRKREDSDISSSANVKRDEPESPLSSPGRPFAIDSAQSNTYIAIANYDPKDDDQLAISEGTVVDVMQGAQEGDLWVVRTINEDGTFGEEGLVPSAYLEKDSEEEVAARRLSSGIKLPKDNKEIEALKLRDNVLKEIIDTERKYIEDLKSVSERHLVQVETGKHLPSCLVGKRDVIFANIRDIFLFHNKTFLPELEESSQDSEALANCFVNRAIELEELYVEYCKSRPTADEILNRPEAIDYWENYQHDNEDPHFIQGYLITPVQRITRYQLLLKVLLKYSTRANQESSTVELALTKTGNIIRLSNDMLHVAKITGYKGDIGLQDAGSLLRHDDVICWEGKAKGRGKDRHLFLFERLLIGTKTKETTRKDEFTYCFKFSFKMSDAGLTETIDSDPKRWRVWMGKSASTASFQRTFEAKTLWLKQSWVKEIREILGRQLSALKESSKRKSAPAQMIEYDDMKNRVTMVRSKSDAPLSEVSEPDKTSTQVETLSIPAALASPAASLKEPCSHSPVQTHLDDILNAEEAYISKDIGLSSKETEPIEIGALYELTTDAKSRVTDHVIIHQGEEVKAIKAGTNLYLVEAKSSENEDPRRCWVPNYWLVKPDSGKPDVSKSLESEFDAASVALPNFSKALESQTALEGDTVIFDVLLDCEADIEWTLDDEKLEESDFIKFETKRDGTELLVLEDVTVAYTGHYGVTASTSAGSISCMADLIVHAPPRFVEKIENGVAGVGSSYSFKCTIDGFPLPEVKWFRGDEEIQDEGRFLIEATEKQAVLDIAEVETSDSGEYVCKIKNEAGEETCRATLSILTVPSQPGRPIVDAVTQDSVTLSWDAPNEDGGSEVTHYMLEQRNEDDRPDDWDLVDDQLTLTKATVDGLTNRDEYTFRVFACNCVGWSKPSKPSAAVVIKAPAPKSPVFMKDDGNSDKERESSDDYEADSPNSIHDDEDDLELSLNEKNILMPAEGDVAPRLSPFSNLKDRRFDVAECEYSSSDDGSPSRRPRTPKVKSPLIFSGNRMHESQKGQVLQNRDSGRVDGGGEIPFGPPIFTKELEDCFIFEGNAAKFKCCVVGNPDPDVEWFKDGEKLVESKQFTMLFDADDNCVLIITHGSSDTAGKITCIAKNSEGTVTSSAMLYVEGLVTEYESESEDEVSDPEPLPERDDVIIKKEDIEGYYTMKDELGRGKFGVVNRCVHNESSKEYAAKFVKCRPREKQAVYSEIKVMNELNHKRLVQLYDAYETSKNIVLVLELVTGGELFEKLTELEYISEHVVVYYIKQVLQGLNYMHERQILHLDLKPENIMLVNPSSNQVKLIDFGLARKYNPNETMQVLCGTPEFVAPEVIGYDTVSTASDMWSIGVITYVLLSGLSPFMGENDAETLANVTSAEWDFDDPVFEDISQEAREFIQDLLIKAQKKRSTVKDCLEHPWLVFKRSKKKLRTDRLKAFTARRKWKKTITAVRSTNFLSRLLSGVKSGANDVKQDKLTTKVTPGTKAGNEPAEETAASKKPGWKRVMIVEDEEPQAPTLLTKLQDIKCSKSDVISLSVQYISDTPPAISWKYEGKEVTESENIFFKSEKGVTTLKIRSACCNDSGRYSVRLENKHGSVESKCQLIVTDVPDEPLPPVVPKVCGNSALVQWQPPFDGNSPIKGYCLECKKVGEKTWTIVCINIKECITVVDDLEPESSYRFRVNAVNIVGQSPFSKPTGFVDTKSSDHVASVMNVPGARRVSRSRSSILEASKAVKIDLQLKQSNPEDHYNFGDEIARGKFAVIKKCTDRTTGDIFAAKLVKYDEDTKEIAKREFDIWNGLSHPNLLVLHDAYLVRKYLVLISEIINGVPILDHLGKMNNPTEDDVAGFITQLLEALEYLHLKNIAHLDVKPGNLMIKGNVLKVIDYGSSRKILNDHGEVGEMVGTAEFMSPEMINFEPVNSSTDIWGVGVVAYALLSGFSPFACEDEEETMASVTALDYRFEPKAFASITEEAKSFIKRIIIRIPEKRPSASGLLEDDWLDESFSSSREKSSVDKNALLDLSGTLKEQDKLEEVRASAVLKTFIQSPYDSPESTEDEDGDEEEDACNE